MLTLTNPIEQANWELHMQKHSRGKTYPPEFDQLIIDLAKSNVPIRMIKEQVSCRSGYVDAVLWRARRRGII